MEHEFKHVDFITIIREGVSSDLACALWTDGDHRCHYHGHHFVGSKKDIITKVQRVIAEEGPSGQWVPSSLVMLPTWTQPTPLKQLAQLSSNIEIELSNLSNLIDHTDLDVLRAANIKDNADQLVLLIPFLRRGSWE